MQYFLRSGLVLLLLLFSGVSMAEMVNINKADAAALMENLPGIGQVKADAIVKYRKENGAFASTQDLLKVPGIGEATFKNLKSEVSVSKGATKATGKAPITNLKQATGDDSANKTNSADKAEKKSVKADEKAEKKADKADDKAEKKSVKADDKADKSEKKAEKKSAKTDEKAERKSVKADEKAEKKAAKTDTKAEKKAAKSGDKADKKSVKAEKKSNKASKASAKDDKKKSKKKDKKDKKASKDKKS